MSRLLRYRPSAEMAARAPGRLALAVVLFSAATFVPAGVAPPAALAQSACVHNQQSVPPPADQTVVLAAPEPLDSSKFVFQIIPADGNPYGHPVCPDAQQLMSHPTIIAVGKDAAITLADIGHYLASNWGAVSVGQGDPAPVLFPGHPEFAGDVAYVFNAQDFATKQQSCRSCVLSGATLNFNGPLWDGPTAYLHDFSDAQMDNTTWQPGAGGVVPLSGLILANAHLNNAIGLQGADFGKTILTGAVFDGNTDLSQVHMTGNDLSGVSLKGVDLRGASLNGVTANGAAFDSSDLSGTQFVGLQVGAAATFYGITLGQSNGACASFGTSDLRNMHMTLSQDAPAPGCETSPAFPGSTIPVSLVAYLQARGALGSVSLQKANILASTGDRSALSGLDLHGVDLTDAAFIGWPVDLTKAVLDGATLTRTSFALADLRNASLRNVNAANASFRGARMAGATFAGSETNLEQANFNDADVSNVSFTSTDISEAEFDRALALNTDFTGVRAAKAVFNGAHIYGNGRAFDTATNLTGVNFTNALLAGTASAGGFDLDSTDLTGATFDGSQCIGCNFTGSKLDGATFIGAFLPGAVLSNATLNGTNLDNAWLYCGARDDSACQLEQNSTTLHKWPLDLAFGQPYGPVPFATTDLTSVSLSELKTCPDGNRPDPSSGCPGDAILPIGGMPDLPIPCSADDNRGAAGLANCVSPTSTLFDASSGKPLSVTSVVPPTVATTLVARGYYVGLDDATIQLIGNGAPKPVAGSSRLPCASPTAPCGDGGLASGAQLGVPAGLAVGLDGSLYIADSGLHRVRRIDPPAADGTTTNAHISTVVGSGQDCSDPTLACGDGFAATAAALAGPSGIWVDPSGYLWIADGRRGLRVVGPDGVIRTVASTPGASTVNGVVGDEGGIVYVSTTDSDYLESIKPVLVPCGGPLLAPGNLVELLGTTQVEILDKSCQRRYVSNKATLDAIEQTYHVAVLPPLSPAVWQHLAQGPALPDPTQDPKGFQSAMQDIFGTVAATVTPVVGTGTSGYNGTTDPLTIRCPAIRSRSIGQRDSRCDPTALCCSPTPAMHSRAHIFRPRKLWLTWLAWSQTVHLMPDSTATTTCARIRPNSTSRWTSARRARGLCSTWSPTQATRGFGCSRPARRARPRLAPRHADGTRPGVHGKCSGNVRVVFMVAAAVQAETRATNAWSMVSPSHSPLHAPARGPELLSLMNIRLHPRCRLQPRRHRLQQQPRASQSATGCGCCARKPG
jgi:uncharacterized protein YjbI with pentapeptide repeats